MLSLTARDNILSLQTAMLRGKSDVQLSNGLYLVFGFLCVSGLKSEYVKAFA